MIIPTVELIVQTSCANNSNKIAVKHGLCNIVWIKLFRWNISDIQQLIKSDFFNPIANTTFNMCPFKEEENDQKSQMSKK